MKEEVKIRITNYEETEQVIKNAGAVFVNETKTKDTYFNQPEGYVKKIVESENSSCIVELHLKNNVWQIVHRENITDVTKQKSVLQNQLGVKCTLRKKKKHLHLIVGRWA